MEDEQKFIVKFLGMFIAGLLILSIVWMAGAPIYNVWEKELKGKAELKQAEWNKKVQIEDAIGKEQSAKHLAQAEIERAKGVARSKSRNSTKYRRTISKIFVYT